MPMKPTSTSKVYETEIGSFWFDDDGILNLVTNSRPRTKESIDITFDFIKSVSKNKKNLVLSDATDSPPPNKEVRDYSADQLPKLTKAMAIMSNSIIGTTIANIFLALKHQVIPMKLFTDEEKARIWLRQFMDEEHKSKPRKKKAEIYLF